MRVYVVTSKSTEKTNDGKINFVRTRCHCVTTDESRAISVTERYNGSYASFDMDAVEDGVLLQYWENPGFVNA